MPGSWIRGGMRPDIALALIFSLRGLLFGNWIARIPAVAELLGVNRAELGSVLIAGALGALVAFRTIGPRISRWGSGSTVKWFGIGWAACYVLVLFAPNPLLFFFAFFAYGVVNGTSDVAINAQAVEVERVLRRPLLSSMHGMFSIGALIGAASGAGFAALDVPIRLQFVFLSSVVVALWYVLTQSLVPDEHRNRAAEAAPRRRVFSLGPRMLWPLGAIAFCAALVEESLADWGALFLAEDLGASLGVAGLGYTIFSGASLITRLMGDRLVLRLGPVLVIRGGAIIVITGFLFGSLVATPWAFLIACAAAGCGFAITLPITYRAAGSMPGVDRATGVAGVATAAYSAFLVGPLVIGVVADTLSLRLAYIGVAILATSVIRLAPAIERALAAPDAHTHADIGDALHPAAPVS